MKTSIFLATILTGLTATSAIAQSLKLSSNEIQEGAKLSTSQVFKGFGCEGGNMSPQLSWDNAPSGTKSFAITAYDPDAPTGSGWWHWNVINIHAGVKSLDAGASMSKKMPNGAIEITNDYGVSGFGGACPPPGEVHRYIFTIYALKVEKLEIPKNASNALTGFMINQNKIQKSSITAVYTR